MEGDGIMKWENLFQKQRQNVYLGINKSKDEMVVDKMQKLEEAT